MTFSATDARERRERLGLAREIRPTIPSPPPAPPGS